MYHKAREGRPVTRVVGAAAQPGLSVHFSIPGQTVHLLTALFHVFTPGLIRHALSSDCQACRTRGVTLQGASRSPASGGGSTTRCVVLASTSFVAWPPRSTTCPHPQPHRIRPHSSRHERYTDMLQGMLALLPVPMTSSMASCVTLLWMGTAASWSGALQYIQ